MCMSIWHRCSPPHVLHVLPIFGEGEGDEVDLVLLRNAADCGHIVLAQQGQVSLDVADLQGGQTINCGCCRSASPAQAPGLVCRAATERSCLQKAKSSCCDMHRCASALLA